MIIREEILRLIRDEQVRQQGNFIPEGDGYLIKLHEKAELLSHEYRGNCSGFVYFYCNDPRKEASYITLLLVAPESRKSSVGATLVGSVLMLTRLRGFKCCRLEVFKNNAVAINLYQKMGFSPIEDCGEKLLMEVLIV
jgi:ribosomal-protein-alanine N-acetyltransferase